MQKLALAMIVGDGQDNDKWDNLLESVEGVVDKIFVNYNGEGDFPYTQPDNMVVEHHPWTDDFSEARNHSFNMVPKGAFDWIMWLDADDTLINPENLKDMLERGTSEKVHQIFLPYIYASDEVDGTPRVTQWRERILSTKMPWKWYYSIHEVCHTQPGSKVVNWDDSFVLHHRDIDPFTHKETRTRNRRILAKASAADPTEPRYIYYNANETFAEAYYLFENKDPGCAEYFKQAIDLYQQFGRTSPSSDDAYIANYRVGDSLRMMEQWTKAIDVAMQGIKIRPRWPECWMLAAHAMLGMKEYDSCEEFVTVALEVMQAPLTNQIAEPITLHYTPYALRALARTELGLYEEALGDYNTALAYWDNPKLVEHKERNLQLAEKVKDKTADTARDKTKHTKPTKSICFLTRQLPEAWNAETLKAGSGGAEWCVHEIARRFAADGFRTAIFGTPGEERGVDTEGVEWWSTDDFDVNEEFTHVVSVRAPEVFDTPMKAKKSKTLWLHDVNMGGLDVAQSPWGNRFDKPDNVVCLTNWHARREQRIYGVKPEKITVIGNGINLEDYPETSTWQRRENAFIYASSPDRGIDTLLQMWPQIKAALPNATLDVYYGWNMLDRIVSLSGGNHPLAQYKERVVAIYDSVKHLDVDWHNRVSRKFLQEVETTKHMWLYPTHFLETYCITALEMMMNGVLPVVNPIGALAETAPWGFHVKGHPNHPDYQKRYVEELVRISSLNEGTQNEIRMGNRAWAETQTWDSRYDDWRAMLGVTAKRKVLVP